MIKRLHILFIASFVSIFCEEPLQVSLTQAEEIALANNQGVQEIENLVEKARYGHLISISDWLPKLELMSQAYQTQHDQTEGSENKSSFLTQIVLTQTLFSAKKYYNLQISNLIYQELQWIKQGILNDVLYRVRKEYYEIILDRNQIETAATHVEVLKALALQMEERLEIGTATTFDVNQLQVAVSNALAQYYQACKKMKFDLDAFSKTLGFDPGSIIIDIAETDIPLQSIPFLREKFQGQQDIFLKTPITKGLFFPPTNPRGQIEWVSQLFSQEEMKEWEGIALKYRPDLLQAESQWQTALKEVSKARGDYLPKLELEASYGGDPTPFNEFPRSSFTNQHFEWGVGVTLKWNIFDSFKRERKISAAKSEALAEKSNLNGMIQEALKEVRNQIFSMENALATNVSSESTLKLAEQALAQAGEKLEIGYISVFDYQIAVNNYIEARNIFFQSQFDVIDSYYQLRHATGIDVKKKDSNHE
ncbi:MAG: TolC family protein [Chlamydiia bacterium]|nr:TolC family protein [Chlamydiia bacterium]